MKTGWPLKVMLVVVTDPFSGPLNEPPKLGLLTRPEHVISGDSTRLALTVPENDPELAVNPPELSEEHPTGPETLIPLEKEPPV